jgi:peptidase E
VTQSCIVALGGAGFGSEPQNPRLERYLLSLVPKRLPRVCFLPTASGDSADYLVRFYNAFGGHSVASHVALFQRTIDDLRGFLLSQDLIYVGGGNTANMLAVWRVHGVDQILREAWDAGIILCGTSAGSICWFESGVTDSFGLTLKPIEGCLGLLPGSNCPHYDSEPQRRPTYCELVTSGRLPAGMAADDGVGLRYAGSELVEIVSSRPRAKAWRVGTVAGEGLLEQVVEPRLLGD